MLKKIKQILYRSIENRDITYKKMINIMKQNPTSILLDVRSSQEFSEGHLENAINIPVYNLKEKIADKVKNKENIIFVYCSSGHRSKRAKELLQKYGYENVYNLKNGLDGIEI